MYVHIYINQLFKGKSCFPSLLVTNKLSISPVPFSADFSGVSVSYVCLLQTCQDKAQISAGSMMLTVIARLFAVKQIKRPYSASTEPSSSLATSRTCGRTL